MRYGLYVRKSTEEDERQAQSIEDQIRLATELAHRNGKDIAVVLSEARSAKEEGRSEFNRMLEMIDAGELDGIVAWHPDRLSRNEMDAAAITKRLRKGQLKDLLFVSYFFHNSPEGIMMLQIALSQSQYYSSKLSGDVKRGMESKIRKGWWPHRALPGYVNDKHMDKGEKTISPDPVRFPIIRRLFEHFMTGAYSGTQLMTLMNEEWGYRSVKTRRGGDYPMTKSTIYRILANVFYAGYFIHDGELCRGKHKPLITLDEYRRVQELLGKLTRMQPKRHEFAYTGTIQCKSCSNLIVAQENINRFGSRYVYYRCNRCTGHIVSAEDLQRQIDAEVDRVALIPDFVEWAVEEVDGWKQRDRASEHAVYAQKASALASVDGQLDSLLTALTKHLITEEEYRARKEKLQSEQASLKIDLDRAEMEAERVRSAIENEVEFLGNVKAWMAFGDLKLRRACLRALGTTFVLDGKKLLLEPHPLLVQIREENKSLEAKYLEVKHSKTLSESQKKALVEPLRSTWSGIWHQSADLVRAGGVLFCRVSPMGVTCAAR